jgi:hypothetical protein
MLVHHQHQQLPSIYKIKILTSSHNLHLLFYLQIISVINVMRMQNHFESPSPLFKTHAEPLETQISFMTCKKTIIIIIKISYNSQGNTCAQIMEDNL